MCMENLSGLFLIFGGGFGWCGCCGSRGCSGVSGVRGNRSRLSEMYLALSVHFGGCFMHLDNLVYNLGSKRVVLLYVVRFFLV
jgi:hypothetical protein